MFKYSINDILENKTLKQESDFYFFITNYYEKDKSYFLNEKDLKKFTVFDYYKINNGLKKIENKKDLNLLFNKKKFYNLNLILKKHVFIPQYDTEELIDIIIERESNNFGLEVGIGAGPIMLSLIKNGNNISLDGIDINYFSIKSTVSNAKRNEIAFSGKLYWKNIFNFKPKIKYDFIVSNPPYIKKGDKDLSLDAKKHQPKRALYAKDNGLLFYKYLIKNYKLFLKDNGRFYFEIGWKQQNNLKEFLKDFPSFKYEFFNDLNGIKRFLVINT